MKKQTRVLCFLLCLLMTVPLLLAGAGAEESEVPAGTVLYEETYDSALTTQKLGWTRDDKYTGQTYRLSISEAFGDAGNHSLHILESESNWCGIQIVPAQAMAGVSQYVLSVKAKWTIATRLTFRMNSPEEGKGGAGNWTGINWTNKIEHTDFKADGTSGGDKTTAITPNADSNDLLIAVDLEAKVIDVYFNGTLINSRPTEYDTASAIYMIVRECDAYIDDLRVTEGTVDETATGRVLYAEDFEGYPHAQNHYLNASEHYRSVPAAFATKTVNGSPCLTYTNTNSTSDNWTGYEVIPASALEGVRRYTIRFDMMIETANQWSGGINFRFGSTEDDTSGNWLRFVHSNDWQNSILLYGDGRSGEKGSVKYPQGTVTGAVHRYAIEVDADAKTVNVYMDGERIIEGKDTSANVGGLWIIGQYYTTAYFDNFLVTAGTFADKPVTYAGTQASPVANGVYSVRLVGVLQDQLALSEYSELGFRVTAVYEGGTKRFDTACTKVYGKLIGTAENNITEEYLASELGGAYLFALSVNGIPVSVEDVTFTVQPYFITEAGTVTGSAYEVVYRSGKLLSQTLLHGIAGSEYGSNESN